MIQRKDKMEKFNYQNKKEYEDVQEIFKRIMFVQTNVENRMQHKVLYCSTSDLSIQRLTSTSHLSF